MMQEYCILEKQRQIEEIQDNYNYRAQNILGSNGSIVSGL